MKSIMDRLTTLEKIADPPAMEPMIIYGHWTEAECAEMNARHVTKNNPLPPMVCRPVSERVQP